MGLSLRFSPLMIAGALAANGAESISEKLPWYQQTITLFGKIEISKMFIFLLSMVLVLAIIVLIAQGFIKEIRRK